MVLSSEAQHSLFEVTSPESVNTVDWFSRPARTGWLSLVQYSTIDGLCKWWTSSCVNKGQNELPTDGQLEVTKSAIYGNKCTSNGSGQ